MTQEYFNKISPGKTIIDAETDEGIKRMLVKFFMCNTENFDGYWMCCTEDLTNPYPTEVREDDWTIYANHAEVVDMRTIK